LAEYERVSSTFDPCPIEGERWFLVNIHTVLYTMAGYLIVVYGLHFILGVKKETEKKDNNSFLDWISAIHNFNMLAFSFICLCGLIAAMLEQSSKTSFDNVWCDADGIGFRGKIAFWMYIYYLSKYYELLDTILIVLRRAPLRFIHTYHHSVTMLVAFAGSYFCGSGVWYPVALNCFVHVIMYYYYILVSFGKTPWWKIYVTDIQNIQFYFDMGGYYVLNIQNLFYEWPRGRRCQGDLFYQHMAAFALLSFRVMFRNLRNVIAKSKMYQKDEKIKIGDSNKDEKKETIEENKKVEKKSDNKKKKNN